MYLTRVQVVFPVDLLHSENSTRHLLSIWQE